MRGKSEKWHQAAKDARKQHNSRKEKRQKTLKLSDCVYQYVVSCLGQRVSNQVRRFREINFWGLCKVEMGNKILNFF